MVRLSANCVSMAPTPLSAAMWAGVKSSEPEMELAARCETDVAFRVISAGQYPDFRTLSDFRKNHLPLFKQLFVEVLRLCKEAGLVRLGHVSWDGSKFQANASKHKAMSYRRIQDVEPQLEEEIRDLLKKAADIDAAEDAAFGADRRGDELPEELRRREGRREKIREAKRRLEERARSRARERAEAKGAGPAETAAAEAAATPSPKEQSNFTDPDSRIMKTKTGWVQGYNAQVMVNEAGIILAEEVTASHADSPRLTPMLDRLEDNLSAVGVAAGERLPGVFTADAGYCSEANLAQLAARGSMGTWPLAGSATIGRASIRATTPGRPCGLPCGSSWPPQRGMPSTPVARS